MHLTSAYLPLVTSWNRRFLVSVPVDHIEKENLLKSTNDGITRGAQKKNKAYKSIRLNHEDTAAILLLHTLHLLWLCFYYASIGIWYLQIHLDRVAWVKIVANKRGNLKFSQKLEGEV